TSAAGAADADEATKGITFLSVAPVSDPVAVGDNDPRVQDFGVAGGSHSQGLVPDPGASTHSPVYVLREDGWGPLPSSAPSEVTLTDAATIAIDASASNRFKVSSATDRTLGIPTNAAAGMTFLLTWKNTDSGARTLTPTTSGAGSF